MFRNHNNVKITNFTLIDTDTTHLASYRCKWNHCTCNSCAVMVSGSAGSVGQSGGAPDVTLYDTAMYCTINDNTSQGIGFSGIWFRHYMYRNAEYQTTVLNYSGDVGFYMFGGGGGGASGTELYTTIIGPVACWYARLNVYDLNNHGDSMVVGYFEKWNSSTFGGAYVQGQASDTGGGVG